LHSATVVSRRIST